SDEAGCRWLWEISFRLFLSFILPFSKRTCAPFFRQTQLFLSQQPSLIYLNRNAARLMRPIRLVTRPPPFPWMVAQPGTHRLHVNVVELLTNELATPDINRRKLFLPNSIFIVRLAHAGAQVRYLNGW